jgi:hypothetical protein
MKEERAARRIDVPLSVEYRPVSVSEWRPVTQGRNVSITGLCFQLEEQIPLGTPVAIRVRVVGSQVQVIATGRIVWMRQAGVVGTHPFEAGLEFTEVDQKAIRLLVKAAYDYWKETVGQ